MPRPTAADLGWAVIRRLWKCFAALPFGDRRCVICTHRLSRFLPYGKGWRGMPALMVALEWIGSDVDHFECPRCGAHDRERHLFLYMSRRGLFSELEGKTVVHFAPEVHLSRIIASHNPALYVTCDLSPNSPEVMRQDLQEMTFETGSVDLFIANHVLEHVADDRQAAAEICRVLKPGGFAILQTPYSPVLKKTWEDAGVTESVARLHAFGQPDHVRLYGRDLVDRIASSGLQPRLQTHAEALPDVQPDRAGVNAREPFLLFQRPPLAATAEVG